MANIHSIDEKKQADRGVALLALHAGQGSVSSACLTEEELACLVDRQCTADEQEQFFSHLASCETCYRSWLELLEIFDTGTGQKTGNMVYKFFQPKQLAWAGSLFAAAASVALFLNISGEMDAPVLQPQMQTGIELKKSALPEEQGDKECSLSKSLSETRKQKKEKSIDVFELEMATPAAAPSLPAPVAEEIDAGKMFTPKQRAKSGLAQKTDQHYRSITDDVAEDAAEVYAAATSLQVSEWLAEIQQGCRSNDENPQFWGRRYLEGKNQLHPVLEQERNLVNDLLPLLDQLEQSKGTGSGICKQILQRINDSGDR